MPGPARRRDALLGLLRQALQVPRGGATGGGTQREAGENVGKTWGKRGETGEKWRKMREIFGNTGEK